PKNSGWISLESASGMNNAGTIVGVGQLTSGARDGFLVTPTRPPTAAVTTSAASLTDAKTPSPAPVGAGARSPHSLADPLRSSAGPHDSPILIALTPASDQDLTPFVMELIRTGMKRSRPAFWR